MITVQSALHFTVLIDYDNLNIHYSFAIRFYLFSMSCISCYSYLTSVRCRCCIFVYLSLYLVCHLLRFYIICNIFGMHLASVCGGFRFRAQLLLIHHFTMSNVWSTRDHHFIVEFFLSTQPYIFNRIYLLRVFAWFELLFMVISVQYAVCIIVFSFWLFVVAGATIICLHIQLLNDYHGKKIVFLYFHLCTFHFNRLLRMNSFFSLSFCRLLGLMFVLWLYNRGILYYNSLNGCFFFFFGSVTYCCHYLLSNSFVFSQW